MENQNHKKFTKKDAKNIVNDLIKMGLKPQDKIIIDMKGEHVNKDKKFYCTNNTHYFEGSGKCNCGKTDKTSIVINLNEFPTDENEFNEIIRDSDMLAMKIGSNYLGKIPTNDSVGWEEEFDKKFTSVFAVFIDDEGRIVYEGDRSKSRDLRKEIKYFIRQTLATSQQDLLERIERELPKEKSTMLGYYGYNQALAEVKEVLQKLK